MVIPLLKLRSLVGVDVKKPLLSFVRKMETEAESKESNDNSIREIAAPHREGKKEIISLSSGNGDTGESSRNISSRAARVRRTGERVCGKWKQRGRYILFIFVDFELFNPLCMKDFISSRNVIDS